MLGFVLAPAAVGETERVLMRSSELGVYRAAALVVLDHMLKLARSVNSIYDFIWWVIVFVVVVGML